MKRRNFLRLILGGASGIFAAGMVSLPEGKEPNFQPPIASLAGTTKSVFVEVHSGERSPTSAVSTGALWYDTSGERLYCFDGERWVELRATQDRPSADYS